MPSLTKVQTGFIEPQGAFPIDTGTAAAPGLKFSDSASTGIFSPSTGVFGISTGSTQQALTILADGKVGIGTINPGTKLDVYGDIAVNGTYAIRRGDYGYSTIYKNVFIGSPDSTANTVSLCVDASTISGGNFHGQNQVIIPHQGLLVPNQAGTNFIGVLSRDANDYLRIGPGTVSGISSGPLTLTSSNVGIGTNNPSSVLHVNGFTTLQNFSSSREDGSSSFGPGGRIDFLTRGSNSGVGGSSGYAALRGRKYTDATNTTLTDVWGITLDGAAYFASNVGIGTDSPEVKFIVWDTSGESVPARIRSQNATLSYLGFGVPSSTTNYNVKCGAYDATSFAIATSNTERLFVDSTGNVGIGTATPSKKLTVYGESYFYHSSGNSASYDFVGNHYSQIQITGDNDASLGGPYYNQIVTNGSDGTLEFRNNSTANLKVTYNGVVQIGGDVEDAANDIDTTNTKLTIKQSGMGLEDGIYLERPSERRGHYIRVATSGDAQDALVFGTSHWGTETDHLLALDRAGNVTMTAGNVGINTTSPSNKLVVINSSTTDNESFFSTQERSGSNAAGYSASGIIISSSAKTSSGNNHTAFINMGTRAPSLNGIHGSTAFITLTSPDAQGSYGTGQFDFYVRNSGPYSFPNDPSVNSGYWMPSLFTIKSSGNIGINQTNPDNSRLHVVGACSSQGELVAKFRGASGTDAHTQIAIVAGYSDTANNNEGHVKIGALRAGSGNTAHITFSTADSASATTEKWRITNSGTLQKIESGNSFQFMRYRFDMPNLTSNTWNTVFYTTVKTNENYLNDCGLYILAFGRFEQANTGGSQWSVTYVSDPVYLHCANGNDGETHTIDLNWQGHAQNGSGAECRIVFGSPHVPGYVQFQPLGWNYGLGSTYAYAFKIANL